MKKWFEILTKKIKVTSAEIKTELDNVDGSRANLLQEQAALIKKRDDLYMEHMGSGSDTDNKTLLLTQHDLQKCAIKIDALTSARRQLERLLAETQSAEDAENQRALKSEFEKTRFEILSVKKKAVELLAEAVKILAVAGFHDSITLSSRRVPFSDETLKKIYLAKIPVEYPNETLFAKLQRISHSIKR